MFPKLKFPPELLEHIAEDTIPAYSTKKLQEIAPYALVNKDFFAAFSRQLYRRIHLLPAVDNQDLGGSVIPSLQSIANNPALGSYVHVFENWRRDEEDAIDQMDTETLESIGLPAFDNMISLRLVRFTPTRVVERLLRNLHSKQRTLSSIHMIGADPRKFIWDPFQVASSGSLKNLTTLHWTFIPGLYPDERSQNSFLLIDQMCFLIAVIEISCPALKDLLLDAESGHGFSERARSGNWILDMGDLGWDVALIRQRTQRARDCSEPCKLTGIRRLALRFPASVSDWPEEEFNIYRDWAQKFFAPSLSSVQDLELGLTCLRTDLDQAFVRKLCSLTGPCLRSLCIRGCRDYCPRAHEVNLDGGPPILRALGQQLTLPNGTTFSLKETIQSLEIDQIHGMFTAELAEELQQWTALTTLHLGDDAGREGEDSGIIDGGWLSLQEYQLEENFITKLPPGVEILQLDIQAPEFSLEREDFEINGPLIFKTLRSLRSFHFVCSTQDDDACIPPWAENEVFIHRLPAASESGSKTRKRLSSTYLQMAYQHSHRLIVRRDIEELDLGGEGEFHGGDETDPWVYSQDEIDFILACEACDIDPFHFMDPRTLGPTKDDSETDADGEHDEEISGDDD